MRRAGGRADCDGEEGKNDGANASERTNEREKTGYFQVVDDDFYRVTTAYKLNFTEYWGF